MKKLHVALVICFGVVLWSHFAISISVVQMTARPGENILLYCDCKQLPGVYIVWYKNSSHEDTPTLVLNVKSGFDTEKKFPRFKFLKRGSKSYDLLIVHANKADEGLYYCGTEETKVEMDENKNMVQKTVYQFGNIITKIKLDSSVAHQNRTMSFEDCSLCWKLLFSLCPAVFIFSTSLTSMFGFLLCWKTETPHDKTEKCESMRPTGQTEIIKQNPFKQLYFMNSGDDVCFAALKEKKKRMIHRSDFRIFTDVMYNMKVED